ncbi:PQ loop repeat protein [Drechmeria coniospora]|uniref:PQ loop repeat protein n=1 Tax=Drechmeria coniospora TaxID=98403 RepID=A0A151GIW1_DRECN|nr:PQ loop repeat protein [Drechmeria coniospora]KYK57037.1 PQ loop repeat protein [Drechmeria coniospora]
MDLPVAANILGILGAVCWSVQLIPQIVVNYRRHHAVGLQPSMMMLWACAGVPLGVYNIVEEFNIALRIQPQILTFLSLATWMQCRHYQRGWSVARSLLAVAPIVLAMGAIQASLIMGLRILKTRAVNWPLTFMAVLSALLLALGVLRHYWDIYLHRTVRGVSFVFVAIDAAGDLFSLVSIFFQPQLDVLGMAVYGTELVLWLGVFACGAWYSLLPWLRETWFSWHQHVQDRRSDDDSAQPGPEVEVAPTVIAMHDMPSTTSVFRTASASAESLRPRIITRRGVNGQDEAQRSTEA